MRTQVSVTLDLQPLRMLQRDVNLLARVVEAAAELAADEVFPDVLAQLAVDPGPVKKPIEWQSERQRRAAWATQNWGAGMPYRRTGRAQDGWYGAIASEGVDTVIELGNTEEKTPYIYGEMTFDFERSAQVQQRMHKNTGWPLAAPIAADGLGEIADRVRDMVADMVFSGVNKR